MPDQPHHEYFLERAFFEMAMSRAAIDPRAAAAHLEMAQRYETLAEEFKPAPPKLRIAT